MAGVSSREIKSRIRSMQSTQAITKAMEMVVATKLARAQAKLLSTRPYFEALHATVHRIIDTNQDFSSVYLSYRPVKRSAWIVIAGDRGLAGGYNSNVLKLSRSETKGNEAFVLPIGKKAVDFFRSQKSTLLSEQYAQAETVSTDDCYSIAKLLCSRYAAEEFDEVRIAYTNCVSALVQTPVTHRLLPLPQQETQQHLQRDILYEPDCCAVLDAIIPEYVGGILYGALCESRAAEQAARRTAMDSASKNADEMIGELSRKYNQSRQAAITQQITEIAAGTW